jgi:hypothetical protein
VRRTRAWRREEKRETTSPWKVGTFGKGRAWLGKVGKWRMHGSRTTNARCTCGELIFIMSACLYHNDGATHFFATRDSHRRFHAETCCARNHGRSVFDHRHRPHNLILQYVCNSCRAACSTTIIMLTCRRVGEATSLGPVRRVRPYPIRTIQNHVTSIPSPPARLISHLRT